MAHYLLSLVLCGDCATRSLNLIRCAAFMNDKFYFFNGAKDRLESSLFSLPPSLADVRSVKDKTSQLPRVIRELNFSLDVYK